MKLLPGEGERVQVDLSHPEHGTKRGVIVWRDPEFSVVEFDSGPRGSGIIENRLLIPVEKVTL